MNHHALGIALRDARIDSGLYLKEAARLIGVSPQLVSSWERGVRQIKATALFRVCAVYGVSVGMFADEAQRIEREMAA